MSAERIAEIKASRSEQLIKTLRTRAEKLRLAKEIGATTISGPRTHILLDEAADLLSERDREIKRLRKALADIARDETIDEDPELECDDISCAYHFHLKIARAALSTPVQPLSADEEMKNGQ